MDGRELFEQVFADEIEEWGELSLSEIQDLDDVTCYDEEIIGRDGWYSEFGVTFRFKGKKYSFEYKDHNSDNVCDTHYYMDTFQEIVEDDNELVKHVNNIISGIENEEYDTFEEIVRDLENLKKFVE